MSIESFLEGLPDDDIEKIAHGLEHTTSGLMKVKFPNMHDMVLNMMVSHKIINRCDKTGSYWRGPNFEDLKLYYQLNIQ